MRTTFLLILSLLFSQSVYADTASKWFGGAGTLNTTANRYFMPMGGNQPNATESAVYGLLTVAGNVTKMTARVSLAPNNGGGTQTWTTTLRRNGTTATAATCVISELETSCTFTGSAALSANDLLTLEVAPASTPAAAQFMWVIEFSSANHNAFLGGGGNALSTTTTQYIAIHSDFSSLSTVDAAGDSLMPLAGVFSDFCVRLTAAPGDTDTRTFTVAVNGTPDTTLQVVFGLADSGILCDNTGTITIADGDVVDIQSTMTGTPTVSNITFGLAFNPTTDGQFAILMTSINATSAAGVRFSHLSSISAVNATEAVVQQVTTGDYEIQACRALSVPAPDNGGGTQSYTVQLRDNGADASAPFTMAISEAATTATATGTFTPTNLNLLGFEITPASTPTSARVHVGCQGYITPTAAAGTSTLLLRGAN